MSTAGPEMDAKPNMSVKTLLASIRHLSQEEKIHLFNLMGVTSEEDLNYLVYGIEEDQLAGQYPEYHVHKILLIYIPPILLILGTFGNVFSFLIMRHKAMTRLSTYIFLAALSVADSMVLLIGLMRQWLGELTGYDIRDQANWLCKATIILGYISSNTSVWIIVAVTIERFIVVCYPLKAQRFCNVARAKKTISGLVVIFLLINIHFVWTAGLNETNIQDNLLPQCDASDGHQFLVSVVWPWVDALIYCFLPFILISIFNVLIICKVAHAAGGRESLQNGCLQLRNRCKGNNNLRLTIMLLTVSFTFLLTTLPMNISIIASDFLNTNGHDNAVMSKFRLVRTISQLLMYLNHSINFFLYCATGQKFRNEVIRMFCGKNNNTLSIADHSQHLFCSRGCPHVSNAYVDARKSTEEIEM
ncbi:probable G-protein coupled receptor 139 [Haliotis asinina]|uniref:probable G-protein coupled receptor 139 n=1 Tax=Haliotis asinina TaxID=109174 RepID=UPI00353184FF